ncbi:MAG TPA: UDP-N-acetylmuramoyl-L-alanine--D-glutamate ligase [Thermoanaerobaculia bacterium]|nr:UDP-N-acetylmuramoyl-L-alanine--D-glutamate ligase [Thermoanaerobaculia bacterium]
MNGRALNRVLVYGLGLSGRAAARLLLARGTAVLAVDDKAADAGGLAVELLSGGGSQALPSGIDAVVVSPGVPLDRPILEDARRQGVPVIAEVELAFPFLNGPVVAITGSNGKSTTTAMVGDMLRAAGFPVEVCGNIGEPLADKVDGPAGRVFVVELSSFQIEGIDTFCPKAAALLNLSEDHLDRYGTLAEYGAAKKRLFRGMDADGVAVLNADDPETLAVETRARRRLFSRLGEVEDGCFAMEDGRVIEVSPDGGRTELFHASDVPLAGVQNLENAMAAALLARALDAAPDAIRAALRTFTGLPHRLQKVGERAGVLFYDDSKGTNPGATLKAIEGFADGTVHLILGGRNKDADLAVLTPMVRRKARRAYLIGESARDFEAALGGAVPFEIAGTMDRAVESAAAQARPGDAVVLSPACASFDQFRNFVHRGQVFQQLVGNITGGPHGEEAGV